MTDTPEATPRRAILAAALAGVAALAAQAMGRPTPVLAHDPDDVLLGGANIAATKTSISTASAIVALEVSSTGNGSNTGIGIHGASLESTGVQGSSSSGVGVSGSSALDVGVYGTSHSETESGVLGVNTFQGPGVHGSATGVVAAGVWGENSHGGIGVLGTALGGSTGGVAATFISDPPGTALDVYGKTRFSRSGRTYIAAGHSTRKITMAGVTTASYVIATPQTNRTGVFVQSVVPAAGSFTIHLNKTVAGGTYIGYLVIN
jgi:hypothetical protein